MGTTLRSLRQDVARVVGGFASGATATLGTTTLLIDTRNASPFDATMTGALQYRGHWAFLPLGPVASGTLPREVSRVLTVDAANRKLTVAPGFSVAVPSGTPFELFGALPPIEVGGYPGYDTVINRALRKLWREWWSFLSLVPDHDMEESGTSDWTASTATLSKVTTAGLVTSGKRALSVVTTGTSGYAATTSIAVMPGERYVLAVKARPSDSDTTTLSLIAHDGSNATTVDSASGKMSGATRGVGWRWLAGEYSIPDGVYSITVRLQASVDSGTTTAYFDDLIVLRCGDRRIPLPSWLRQPERQLVEVYQVNVTSAPLDGGYATRQEERARWDWWEPMTVADAGQEGWLQLDPHPSLTRVPLVRALRTYGELSDELDATEADKDLVIALSKIEALQALVDLAQGQDASLWGKKLEQAQAELRRDFGRVNPNPPRRGPQLSKRF